MRIHSAIAYFDNVMTNFMINNRTDAWKTDVNLLSITGCVPIYCVLNTVFVIYRKRSNMRRAFVIFLAICFIAFSLNSRFVYSRCSSRLRFPIGRAPAHVPEQRLVIELIGASAWKVYNEQLRQNIKTPSENSSRSGRNSRYLSSKEELTFYIVNCKFRI